MSDDIFDSAAERIEFGQMADSIEQGRADIVPARLADRYVGKGLMERRGNALRLTELGREQQRVARDERSSDG
jgi:hypothetical protein